MSKQTIIEDFDAIRDRMKELFPPKKPATPKGHTTPGEPAAPVQSEPDYGDYYGC